jgi:hypothetical protein
VRGPFGVLPGRVSARLLALVGGCLLSLSAAPGSAATAASSGAPPALNGPGSLLEMRLALGDLTIAAPSGCAVPYSLQVVTEVAQGNDDFELQVYDDGALVQVESLSAPSDGELHEFSGTIRLDRPVSQTSPGIGVYLVDSDVILDFVDPVPVACGVVEIPTLGSVGAWILGAMLLASGFAVLRRPRRSC